MCYRFCCMKQTFKSLISQLISARVFSAKPGDFMYSSGDREKWQKTGSLLAKRRGLPGLRKVSRFFLLASYCDSSLFCFLLCNQFCQTVSKATNRNREMEKETGTWKQRMNNGMVIGLGLFLSSVFLIRKSDEHQISLLFTLTVKK